MACAFTQKIVKLSKMLMSLGHTVYLYGAEGSDAPCTEFIQTHSLKDIRDAWGEGNNLFDIGYNWKKQDFKHDFNSEKTDTTKKYYANCVTEIKKRKKDDHFLLITQGFYQKPIDDALEMYLTIEPGIGYRGSYAKFRAFESSYLQNFTYGSEHPRESINGNYYDRVIPNYYDAKDFPKKKIATVKDDYYLYFGRQIARKGIDTAIKTCDAIGAKLKIGGQGKYKTKSKNVEFTGYADPEKRFELMTNAKAVFVPTLYLEAFGGVSIEAMLCGTPVISTNFGVFPETITPEVGARGNTLKDFVKATKTVQALKPRAIRKHASKYLLGSVKLEFQRWFEDLHQVYLSTQDDEVKAWHFLD